MLDFTVDYSQTYYDPWRGTDRICYYVGKCITCGIRTYAFIDGENDPRGPLGDHANYSLRLSEYDENWNVDIDGEIEVCQCFQCGNEYGSYMQALEIAKERANQYNPYLDER